MGDDNNIRKDIIGLKEQGKVHLEKLIKKYNMEKERICKLKLQNGQDCVYGNNKNIDGNDNKIKIIGGNDSINIFVGGSGDGNRLNNINLGNMSTASGLYINIKKSLYIFILKFVYTGRDNNQAPSSYFKHPNQLPSTASNKSTASNILPSTRYLLSESERDNKDNVKDDDNDTPIIDHPTNNDKDDDDDIKIIDNPTNKVKSPLIIIDAVKKG